jgi:hypothetical protein
MGAEIFIVITRESNSDTVMLVKHGSHCIETVTIEVVLLHEVGNI